MSSDEKGYNGWHNYETWCVNLWLSNDQGLYNEVTELATSAVNDADQEETDWRDDVRYELADTLKEFVDELAEMTCPGCREGASFVSDLIGAALSEVDWSEIAVAWLEDVDEYANEMVDQT